MAGVEAGHRDERSTQPRGAPPFPRWMTQSWRSFASALMVSVDPVPAENRSASLPPRPWRVSFRRGRRTRRPSVGALNHGGPPPRSAGDRAARGLLLAATGVQPRMALVGAAACWGYRDPGRWWIWSAAALPALRGRCPRQIMAPSAAPAHESVLRRRRRCRHRRCRHRWAPRSRRTRCRPST